MMNALFEEALKRILRQ